MSPSRHNEKPPTTIPSASEQEEDFTAGIPTKERQDIELALKSFTLQHASHHRPIALVTSGGTAADLEIHSVRCLDNFSTGLRGAISVEEFLQRGYAVIHLWRNGSASPYARVLSEALHMTQANFSINHGSLGKLFATSPTATGVDVDDDEENIQDHLVQSVLREAGPGDPSDPWMTDPTSSHNSSNNNNNNNYKDPKQQKPSLFQEVCLHRRIRHSSKLQQALKERNQSLRENRLLTIPFRTVDEYLGKLQLCALTLRDSQALAVCYLAAAVSDFYVPKAQRSLHKIQSKGGSSSLTLTLSPVPKVLGLLRQKWAPDAFICSFKLETDRDMLRSKAKGAVQNYGCHLVIGNILTTRYDQVSVLAPSSHDTTPTTDVDSWSFTEIKRPQGSETDVLESMIIDFVVQSHFYYISTRVNGSLDKVGTLAVLQAQQRLQDKKEEVDRQLFWNQAQTIGLEWLGVVIGCGFSYVLSSALKRRMGG